MRGRKNTVGKIYPKYQPYPLSWNFEGETYSGENDADSRHRTNKADTTVLEDLHDLVGDPASPDWFTTKPLPSNDERPLRPLRLLQSLFADRLGFLHRALDELESAKEERQRLTRYAMQELDPEIRDCEHSLSVLSAVLSDPERKQHLERRLLELKRERRRETLLSWRHLVRRMPELPHVSSETPST